MLVLVGGTAFGYVATANTTLQLSADPVMRGRVMALYAIAFLGSTPIGSPIVGWIAHHNGARVALVGGAVATLAATLYGWHTLVRGPRSNLRHEPAREGGSVTQVRVA